MSGPVNVDVVKPSLWKRMLPSGSALKAVPLVGVLGAAAVTLPFIVGGMRNERRFNEDNAPLPKSLSDPLPPVLEFTPNTAAASPQTMMGQMPVEGAFAQREKLRRAGGMAGPDMSSPNTMAANGVSVIDGKHVQDLNKESSLPAGGPSL